MYFLYIQIYIIQKKENHKNKENTAKSIRGIYFSGVEDSGSEIRIEDFALPPLGKPPDVEFLSDAPPTFALLIELKITDEPLIPVLDPSSAAEGEIIEGTELELGSLNLFEGNSCTTEPNWASRGGCCDAQPTVTGPDSSDFEESGACNIREEVGLGRGLSPFVPCLSI